jgi:hypothetical protein
MISDLNEYLESNDKSHIVNFYTRYDNAINIRWTNVNGSDDYF